MDMDPALLLLFAGAGAGAGSGVAAVADRWPAARGIGERRCGRCGAPIAG
ncbi:MAG: hypothetical protein JO290_05430, partial [Sphingomonadaceae bacterium]|nr:hypothetical protein [Sphingomonadaceae bacterium]